MPKSRMTMPGWDFGDVQEANLITRAQSQLDHVVRTIRLASALTSRSRQVDLSGLEQQVGLLCAQTLDLGWPQARALRPKLAGLLIELDNLANLQFASLHNAD